MPKQYTHNVVVIGKVSFPYDMLRYDNLEPKSTDDGKAIARTHNWLDRKPNETFTVHLTRKGPSYWEPTYLRWESFLWRVKSHEMEKS